MAIDVALRAYEDYLLEKKKFSLKSPAHTKKAELPLDEEDEYHRQNEIKLAKEADALAVIRYAITGVLGWSPGKAFEEFDGDVADSLKLKPLIKYVQFPRNLSPSKDYWWIISKIFPSQVEYNKENRALEMYKRVLRGEMGQFPKTAFDTEADSGILDKLLHYYISTRLKVTNKEDLYELFSQKSKAVAVLKEAQLYNVYKSRYRSPLDWLHVSLGNEGDDFLYQQGQFMEMYRHRETGNKVKRYQKEKAEKMKKME